MLKVSGYIRGRPLRLHSLMHVCGAGAGRLESIEVQHSPIDKWSSGGRARGAKNVHRSTAAEAASESLLPIATYHSDISK